MLYKDIFKSKYKSLMLILFFSIIAFGYNYVNVKSINTGSEVLKFGYTYQSPDDHTYVDPAINFIKGLGYIIDPSNEHWNVRRTPVYSVFYGIHYWLFGYEMSFFWVRIS